MYSHGLLRVCVSLSLSLYIYIYIHIAGTPFFRTPLSWSGLQSPKGGGVQMQSPSRPGQLPRKFGAEDLSLWDDSQTIWGNPVNLRLYSPKVPGRIFFPNLSNFHYWPHLSNSDGDPRRQRAATFFTSRNRFTTRSSNCMFKLWIQRFRICKVLGLSIWLWKLEYMRWHVEHTVKRKDSNRAS